MPKLSKRVVDAIRPNSDGKDVFLWDSGDGALKGFGVRMKPSGSGAYIVQYRTAEGRTRRLALGKIGTLTPDEARILARDKLVAATKGADPSAERHAARASMTVAELCDLYLAQAASRIKASTLANGPKPDRPPCQAAAGAPDRAEPHTRRHREDAARHRRR